MRQYKIMSSTREEFNNIELPLDLDKAELGDEVFFLGSNFIVLQNNKVFQLANKDWVLSLIDVTPEPVVKKSRLIINENIEIYFETKEIEVKIDCTYKELFEFLQREWDYYIKRLELGEDALPFEYDGELKLFTFLREWNFANGSLMHMKEGSYSRKNLAGRNI